LETAEQKPIWKMICTEENMLLQYYDPVKHISTSTIYGFTTKESGTSSLYYPLQGVFLKRWLHDSNVEVPLD
jgi:hypothetical protein